MVSCSSISAPPFASNTDTLNRFSPLFESATSTVALSASTIRPELHPVSRLSTWNSVPDSISPSTCATIFARSLGVRAV